MALFGANVWRRVLGVDRATVIEDVDFDEESDTVVVHVRPRRVYQAPLRALRSACTGL